MTDLGTFTDASGEMYRIGQGTYTHTYASEGPWIVSAGSCCRIYSLINASGGNWALASTVAPRDRSQSGPANPWQKGPMARAPARC